MRALYQGLVIGFSLLLAGVAVASQASESLGPDQVVEQATQRVMSVIEEARTYHDENPERYYQAIDEVMADVVDYQGFARGVMGGYASKQRYDSLQSDAERDQFKAQVERFSTVFRQGLIRTYAKGLLAFNGERIEVLPVDQEELKSSRSVNVVQHIFNGDEGSFEVVYKMRQMRDGEWKLLNVTIEGVNLGLTYRNQFAQSVKENAGDIDQVIDNWAVVERSATEQSSEG